MKRLVESLFGLRKGERGLALWMFLYHYLLLVTLYFLKPIRDSLFLVEIGARELPLVFILTTLAVMPVAVLYARASRWVALGWLVNSTTLVLVANLIVLYWLLGLRHPWIFYVLYVWVSIYGVLVTSQFWLFANAVFDPAQAKRTFALLSVGAILGAVTGGEVTGLLVDGNYIESRTLVPMSAVLLGLTVPLVNGIRARAARQQAEEVHADEAVDADERPVRIWGILQTLRSSRHLLLIVGIIALAVLTTTIVDFQFKTVAAEAFPEEGNLSAFMGRFYSRVSIVALLFQVLLAPRLIRLLGAGGSLLLLPAGLAAGSFWMLLAPGLTAGTVLRGIDQSLKHSIDKTGRELLFLPIGLETKKRVKVFVDLFMDHVAQGVGGVLLLVLTIGLGLNVQQISFVMMGLLGVWMGLVLLARSSYVEAFRASLEQQVDAEREEPAEEAEDEVSSMRTIERRLSSRNPQHIVQGLQQLEEREAKLPVSSVQRLLEHRSAEVRRHAIRVLRKRDVGEMVQPVSVHLEDHEPVVRLEAARYIYRQLNGDHLALLERGLNHPDARVRAVVVGLIAKEGGAREYALVTNDMLEELVRYEGEAAAEGRLQVARILGVLQRPVLDDLLHQLMHDEVPKVARRAIRSAGRRGNRAFLHPLLEQLTTDTFLDTTLQALADFGDRILGTLYDYMTDPHVDPEIRQRVPHVAARIGTQAAVDVLLVALEQATVPVRHAIAVALSTLRAEDSGVRFSWEVVREQVRAEAEVYAALGQIVYLQRHTDEPAAQAYPREVLQEARAQSLERIFRLLGLYYLQPDMHNAFRGLQSEEQSLRADAVEFIDSLLDWETKQFLMPLLNDPTGEQAAEKTPEAFGINLNRWSAALDYLLRASDPRLIAPATKNAAEYEVNGLRAHIEEATHHPDRAVRKAAREALATLEQADAGDAGEEAGASDERERTP